jgi:hypothetical protein
MQLMLDFNMDAEDKHTLLETNARRVFKIEV